MRLSTTLYVVDEKYNEDIMKKVTNLIDYKHMLLKREGELRVSRGLIDEDADAEDVMFELEGSVGY